MAFRCCHFGLLHYFIFLLIFNSINCVEKNSLKMSTSPDPELKGMPKWMKMKMDYFKPKEYSTRDFPRLIEGLGQQIRRDLGQAHSMMASYSKQVQNLEQKMDRLEATNSPFISEFGGENQNNKLLAALWLFLLLFLVLAFLFCVNLLLILLSSRRKTKKNVKKIVEI